MATAPGGGMRDRGLRRLMDAIGLFIKKMAASKVNVPPCLLINSHHFAFVLSGQFARSKK